MNEYTSSYRLSQSQDPGTNTNSGLIGQTENSAGIQGAVQQARQDANLENLKERVARIDVEVGKLQDFHNSVAATIPDLVKWKDKLIYTIVAAFLILAGGGLYLFERAVDKIGSSCKSVYEKTLIIDSDTP